MCITFSDMQFDSANEATGVNGRSEYPIICNAIKDNPLLQKIHTKPLNIVHGMLGNVPQ